MSNKPSEYLVDDRWEVRPFKYREPWVVVDYDWGREWLLPRQLQYYLFCDQHGTWAVCDRFSDYEVPGTASKSRAVTIRRFYRWCKRPLPRGVKLRTLYHNKKIEKAVQAGKKQYGTH